MLLGRYRERKRLGVGSFGEVVEVEDIESGIHYALKRISAGCSESDVASIRRNFRLVSELTHPHITVVRFLERDPSTGELYVIMDLVRGTSLADWLSEFRRSHGDTIPLPIVLGIAEQLASALDYAHDFQGPDGRDGIVHCDLKPANIMAEQGREFRDLVPYVKLVDFGIAAHVQASLVEKSQVARPSNARQGTPLYMAPEQWLGRTITRGIDQWALAVIIYEMLEGNPPFFAQSIDELKRQIIKGDPVEPSKMTSTQWNVLRQSFNHDRTKRHTSCSSLVADFARAERMPVSGHVKVAPAGTLVVPDQASSSHPGAVSTRLPETHGSEMELDTWATGNAPRSQTESLVHSRGLLGLVVVGIGLLVLATSFGIPGFRGTGNSPNRIPPQSPDSETAIPSNTNESDGGGALDVVEKQYVSIERVECEVTNDLDGVDQVVISFFADDEEVARGFRYPDEHDGTPCIDLGAGELFEIDQTIGFTDSIRIRVGQIDRVQGYVDTTIRRKHLNELNSPLILEDTGTFNRCKYKLFWRKANAPGD